MSIPTPRLDALVQRYQEDGAKITEKEFNAAFLADLTDAAVDQIISLLGDTTSPSELFKRLGIATGGTYNPEPQPIGERGPEVIVPLPFPRHRPER